MYILFIILTDVPPNINAPKESVGVLFVRNKLFSIFDISILDKTYDGILRISLLSKNTDYSIAVCATYLPPESKMGSRRYWILRSFIRAYIYT